MKGPAALFARHGLDEERLAALGARGNAYKRTVSEPPAQIPPHHGRRFDRGPRPELACNSRLRSCAGARRAVLRRTGCADLRRHDPAQDQHQRQRVAERAQRRPAASCFSTRLRAMPSCRPRLWCCPRTVCPFTGCGPVQRNWRNITISVSTSCSPPARDQSAPPTYCRCCSVVSWTGTRCCSRWAKPSPT